MADNEHGLTPASFHQKVVDRNFPEEAIKRAVAAERERCARRADSLRWGENVDPGGSRHRMILYVSDVGDILRKGE